MSYTSQQDGALLVDGAVGDIDCERIGRLALEHGVPLSEVRRSDSAGIEDLFFSLTGDVTKETAA